MDFIGGLNHKVNISKYRLEVMLMCISFYYLQM